MIKLDCITLQCFHCSTQVFAFQGHIVLFSSWEYSAGRSTCLKKCSSVRARAKLNLLMRSRKIVNHCDILGHQPIASPPHTTTTSWTKSLDSSGSNITIAWPSVFIKKLNSKIFTEDFYWRNDFFVYNFDRKRQTQTLHNTGSIAFTFPLWIHTAYYTIFNRLLQWSKVGKKYARIALKLL